MPLFLAGDRPRFRLLAAERGLAPAKLNVDMDPFLRMSRTVRFEDVKERRLTLRPRGPADLGLFCGIARVQRESQVRAVNLYGHADSLLLQAEGLKLRVSLLLPA